jgi:hypothetical protein
MRKSISGTITGRLLRKHSKISGRRWDAKVIIFSRFDVLIAELMEIQVASNLKPCRLVCIYWLFWGYGCPHLQIQLTEHNISSDPLHSNHYLTTELNIKKFVILFLSRHFQGVVNVKIYWIMVLFRSHDESEDLGFLVAAVAVRMLNPLKTRARLLYLKIQFVSRCKHFSSRL